MSRTRQAVAGVLWLACAILLQLILAVGSPAFAQSDEFNSNSGSSSVTQGSGSSGIPPACSGPGGCPGSYFNSLPTGTQTYNPSNTGCGNPYGCPNTTGPTGTQAVPAPTLQGGVKTTAPLQGSVQQTAPLQGSVQQQAPATGSVQQATPATPLPGSAKKSAPLVGSVPSTAGQVRARQGAVPTLGVPTHNYPTANVPSRGNPSVGRYPQYQHGQPQGGKRTQLPAHSGRVYNQPAHSGIGLPNLPGVLNALPGVGAGIAGAVGTIGNIFNGFVQGVTRSLTPGASPATQYRTPYPYSSGGQPGDTQPPRANYPYTMAPSTAYAPRLATQQPYSACRECSNHNWKSFPKENELFRNVRELAELVFGRYNTGYPFGIGIVKLRNFGQAGQEACLVVASGTDLKWSQSTGLLEQLSSTEGLRDNYQAAIEKAIKEQCGTKKIILVGHSLGGMVLQRVASLYGSRVLALIDLGSPTVEALPNSFNSVPYVSFNAIGDPIPGVLGADSAGVQILADDRKRECFPVFPKSPSSLVPFYDGLTIDHMYYPCDHALDDYDVLGKKQGGTDLNLENWYTYTVPMNWGKAEGLKIF